MEIASQLAPMATAIRKAATGYCGLVARGDMTRRLAGAFFRRYADGVHDTAAALFGLSACNPLGELIDTESTRLDPLWRESRDELSRARPADLALTRRIAIPQLDRPSTETRVTRASAATSRIRLDDDER